MYGRDDDDELNFRISGISQFWTDDYKVFDQIYGKTSDKEIYGDNLPPTIGYSNPRKPEASEKKERYIDNDDGIEDSDQIDPYGYGIKSSNYLTKQSLNKYTAKKPAKSPFKFISTDFKPISHASDPETYNYLKHLEKLTKHKAEFPEIAVGGFKPYVSYSGGNPEDTDAYKSIQDILEAHEANKGKENDETDDQVKYLTYPPKGRGGGGRSAKKPTSRPQGIDKSKIRCPSGSGRCRKRATNTYRIRTRPYLRRIKHKIVY